MVSAVVTYLSALLMAGLYILDFAEGLTRCRVRSGHCWPSPTQTLTNHTLHTYPTAACPTRGHFPHPDDTLLYYRCPDVGARACTCRCRYEGMCFSATTRRCEFSFLPEFHNCTGDVSTSSTTITTGSSTTTEEAKSGDHKDMPVMLSNTEHIHRLHERPQAARQVAPHSFAARQSGPRVRGAHRDHVPFPIWAVAIVALSLLVMLVLIVVLMYNNNVEYL